MIMFSNVFKMVVARILPLPNLLGKLLCFKVFVTLCFHCLCWNFQISVTQTSFNLLFASVILSNVKLNQAQSCAILINYISDYIIYLLHPFRTGISPSIVALTVVLFQLLDCSAIHDLATFIHMLYYLVSFWNYYTLATLLHQWCCILLAVQQTILRAFNYCLLSSILAAILCTKYFLLNNVV